MRAFSQFTQGAGIGLGLLIATSLAVAKPVSPSIMQQFPVMMKLPVNLGLPAQSTKEATDLTLEQAVAYGLAANYDVKAAEANAASFKYTADAARGALLPKLDWKVDKGRGRLESTQPYVRTNRSDNTLTLKQALFDMGAKSEWDRQKMLAVSALRQLDAAKAKAVLEISDAYLQTMQYRLALEFSQEYEDMMTELLRYISVRAEGGAASPADRERVRSRVENARSVLADTRSLLQTSMRNLQRLVHRPAKSISLVPPSFAGIAGDIAEAQAKGLTDNSEILAAKAEEEAALFEQQGARRKMYPTIDLEVTHAKNVNASGTESLYRDTKVMIVMNYSIFNGGSDLAQSRAASERRNQKEALRLNAEEKLQQELDDAYLKLSAIKARKKSLEEEIKSNQLVVEAYKEQMLGSNRSLLDVMDAYQRLYQSKQDAVTLMVTELQLHLRVAQMTGGLSDVQAVEAPVAGGQ